MHGMETGAVVNEFVTIVPVGETKPADKEPAFVTVLTLGAEKGAAEISIRRPKGARLGLGLKFEGGSAASEKVRRLLVQSCAGDSPAANACAPWGKLIPGDEILAIDGVSVSELTRIECVRRLKDSDETLTLLVRHFEVEPITQSNHSIMETLVTKDGNESGRPTMLPPPVPPRKLGKKNSFKDKPTLQTVGEQNALLNLEGQKQVENGKDGENRQNATLPANNKLSRKSSFDSHLLRQNKDSFAYLRKGSPEEARRLVRRLSDGKTIPPEAEVYIDLLSNEWERCLILADGESDDTGSSISTVVDRLGSMASSVENSIPSTPVMQPKSIDIQKVLNSIENIDTDLLKDMRNTKFMEKPKNVVDEPKKVVEKITTVNVSSNNEKVTLNKSLTEKNNSINVECSDKNNNNTKNVASNRENLERCQTAPNKSDQNVSVDKPKPMPRNTKIERSSSEKKRRPAPIPEVLTSPLPEPLLTPTKKTCIETWLQHSEAEMNESLKDKIESNPVPEILPRLIDFVPKTQFKESGNENNMQTCARPTVPPPPPPAETREDGSGASLDTIGELDEPSDVTDNATQSTECQTEKSKTYDRSFWNDRVNKSDIEEKSLSNDESPLPTCPRQPPDGVETPSETVEKTPDLPTRLPPSRLSTGWTNTRPRYSYSSRTQDARSEASVKDKIAMFSVESASTDCIDKCSTLPTRSYSTLRKTVTPYKSSYVEVSSLDRRLTKSQDNLDETPRSYKRHTDRPEVLGAPKTKSTNISNKPIPKSNINDKPLFYGSTTNLHSDTSFMRPVYHARSISDDTSKKVSSHKSNLEYLIEQRKKSMSKLRGLVIPEVQTAIVDLPEIKVKDSFTNIYLQNTNYSDIKKQQRSNDNGRINFCENKWKSNLLPNNIPKYSPAFKRKSLQVYTSLSKEPTPERKILDKTELSSKKIGSPITTESMKKPYDYNKSPLYKTTNYILSKDYGKNNLNNISMQDYKNVEIKICTATDIVDSDNDSAMSSTQSSYRSSASSPMYTLDTIESDSSRLSPRISNYSNYSMVKHEVPIKTYVAEKVTNDDFMKRKVCRSMSSDTNISLSSSAGSAATSGSQASCSSLESSVADSDKRRVSKTYNVDTINRRNILASAKCRSGRDAKLESPVLETKFSHESYNRSPSPINKTSECLSTLTSSVSAIANKGENRRRNKFILESDSDTDSEKNMRLRKSEYKNTRLKRNSSASKKQNEVVYENGKGEQNSSYDKEEKVKDVKKIVTNEKSQTNENTNKIVNNRQEVEEVYKGKTLFHRTNELITTKPILDGNSQANTKVDIKLSTINTTPQNVFTQTYRLRKGSATGVGLILAGGTDCEAKDVTVHRVLVDGIAAKAGIRRGSKVRSINGNLMSGLTHAQSVSILKEQRAEVVIEIENGSLDKDSNTDGGSEDAESKGVDAANGVKQDAKSSRSLVTVLLEKIGGGAGLGFGLDGGRDSPQGDKPLTIKKLFAGGAAAQSGRVTVGAELLSVGGQSMEGYTRTQAWAALKALPPGQVELVLRNPSNSNGEK